METRKIKPDRRGAWQQGCTTEVVHIEPASRAVVGQAGSIVRIERTCSTPGHVASMHAHRGEEILTCIRSGTLLHIDSLGHEEKLWSGRLMLLDAGAALHHEERTLGRDPVNGYNVYFRPDHGETEPAVQFIESGPPPLNEWRILASREGAPLVLRSRAEVHDGRFSSGVHHLPIGTVSRARILIVFEGRIRIGGERLQAGDVLRLGDGDGSFHAYGNADLLLVDDEMELSENSAG